jgi:hypothetical protein
MRSFVPVACGTFLVVVLAGCGSGDELVVVAWNLEHGLKLDAPPWCVFPAPAQGIEA